MSTPSELLRRAARSRGLAPGAVQGALPPGAEVPPPRMEAAAPADPIPPLAARPQGASAVELPPRATQPEAGAQPPRGGVQSHHAAYTALMRSHDRMRTNHLPVQTRGAGA